MGPLDEFPPEWGDEPNPPLVVQEGEDNTDDEDLSLEGLSEDGSDCEVLPRMDSHSDSDSNSDWHFEFEGEEEVLDELSYSPLDDDSTLLALPHPAFKDRQEVECTIKFRKGLKILAFFYSVISKALLNTWVTYTNHNMEKHFEGKPRISHGKPCAPVERREIEALIGILIISGVTRLRSIRDAYR